MSKIIFAFQVIILVFNNFVRLNLSIDFQKSIFTTKVVKFFLWYFQKIIRVFLIIWKRWKLIGPIFWNYNKLTKRFNRNLVYGTFYWFYWTFLEYFFTPCKRFENKDNSSHQIKIYTYYGIKTYLADGPISYRNLFITIIGSIHIS